MRRGRIAATAGLVAALSALLAGWLWQRPGVRVDERPAATAGASAPAVVPVPPAEPAPAVTRPAPLPAAPEHPELAFPDPFGDLAHYEDAPLSEVPHRVVRGWGVGPRSRRPGAVGAVIVVDPALGRADLIRLVQDIRAYHRDADMLAVRILDSMEAASYDRHADGGELLAGSQVASVHRSEALGLDEAEVLGEALDVASEVPVGESSDGDDPVVPRSGEEGESGASGVGAS